MCNDMFKSQIYFMKKGKHPIESTEQAFKLIYNNKRMKSFMIDLALSLFFWFSHFKIYQFLLKNINSKKENIKSYLEIELSYDLFLKDTYQFLGNTVEFTLMKIL